MTQTPRQYLLHVVDNALAPDGLGTAALAPLSPLHAVLVRGLATKARNWIADSATEQQLVDVVKYIDLVCWTALSGDPQAFGAAAVPQT